MSQGELKRIDLKLLDPNASALQSSYWATVKQSSGWNPCAFSYQENRHAKPIHFLVLIKTLVGKQQLAYIPFASGIEPHRIGKLLKPLLGSQVAFVRFDLPWNAPYQADANLIQCRYAIQPEATVRLNLTQGYERVASAYKKRTLRHLKKRDPLMTIACWDEKDEKLFNQWYALYRQRAQKAHFSPRSADYIKRALQLKGLDGESLLFLACKGNSVLGGIVVLFGAKEALYLYGATAVDQDASISYVLQDYAIGRAIEKGCSVYDLYGISTDATADQHLKSLKFFKQSFGGEVYSRPPTVDYRYKKGVYGIYVAVERIWLALHR